ncbi:hypothetical protein [Nocardia sp. SYP-A9097]|uniref:hypothetical protein n=1 Tax=Nocardia sp. SYP-A9097 TaxID=2663237 RepID=UPI00189171A7|nr:hypothetical protein [Nocardia sp. SYP-A9097]
MSEHYSVDLVGSTVIVIIGLVVLVAAVMVGLAGVLANGGVNHVLTDNFAVFGYHVTGSTGLLFLYGTVVGAAGLAGMSLLLAGARRTARLGRTARSELEQSRHETAAVSRDRDDLADRQPHLDEQRRRTTASPGLDGTRGPEIPEPTVLRVATDSTFSDSATDRGTTTPSANHTSGAADATCDRCSPRPRRQHTRKGPPHEHR